MATRALNNDGVKQVLDLMKFESISTTTGKKQEAEFTYTQVKKILIRSYFILFLDLVIGVWLMCRVVYRWV